MKSSPVYFKKILWAAPLSGVAAAVANTVVYLLAQLMGAVPNDVIVPVGDQPITLLPVIMASFLAAIAAGILLAVLALITRKAVRVLIIIATMFVILSFYMPFTIPEAFGGMILALNLMHVVAAVVIVALLIRFSGR